MFYLMDPPIEDSIIQIDQGCWLLGSAVICESVSEVPNGSLKSWEADNGNIYCLRTVTEHHVASLRPKNIGSSRKGRVHHAGTSAAVWNIGGIYIKVKAWRPNMQLESDTIKFANKVSPFPTPGIIYSWVDTQWNRSFLMLESVNGRTLSQAWTTMSSDRRTRLANKIARLSKSLAVSKSQRIETADGKGVIEPFLTAQPPDFEPSWRPQFLGPYTSEQLQTYLSCSLATNAVAPFVFFHADLGPGNIIVDAEGDLTAVIDWESAAFYPMFWLGTKPLVSAGFFLPGADRKEWAVLLTKALEREGFAPDMEQYSTWKSMIDKKKYHSV